MHADSALGKLDQAKITKIIESSHLIKPADEETKSVDRSQLRQLKNKHLDKLQSMIERKSGQITT